MHIQSISIRDFKRFKSLRISGLTPITKLVVLVGPNGSGKSSLFDAFNVWYFANSQRGSNHDPEYYSRSSVDRFSHYHATNDVQLEFFEPISNPRKSFSIRTAHRNEPDFVVSQIPQVQDIENRPVISRLIDNDQFVSANFVALLSETVSRMYAPEMQDRKVGELVNELVGEVRGSLERVFDDLSLVGIDQPFSAGTFRFIKGTASNYHYKNLSAGEKSAFDLLLDMVVKRAYFDQTIFCVDEPEAHLNSRVQASLIQELYRLVPSSSQLWIATHSIGMMRAAQQLHQLHPGSVEFLDFFDRDFDTDVELTPTSPNRAFWSNILDSALGDLAQLVAPSTVFLCEGKAPADLIEGEIGFDAKCYKRIFGDAFPDVEFLSIGSSQEIKTDSLNIGRSIQTLVTGVNVVRLVDLDDHSESEVSQLNIQGIRVLSRRHIESYLLDDEILAKLCHMLGKSEKYEEVIRNKQEELEQLPSRNKPIDDVKAASRSLYAKLRNILDLRQAGSDTRSFLYEFMTPLITPETEVYRQLFADLFGSLRDDGKV